MEIILAVVIGALFTGGIYLMLRRSLIRLILGLILLGHAANLTIFTVGGLTRGQPPLIAPTAEALNGVFADPLPQALILTAIVIGFGLQAFAVVLAFKVYWATGVDDLDQLRNTE